MDERQRDPLEANHGLEDDPAPDDGWPVPEAAPAPAGPASRVWPARGGVGDAMPLDRRGAWFGAGTPRASRRSAARPDHERAE